MLKKEFNRLEVSINKPFETLLYDIPRGRYCLRVIHQCEATYKRAKSLFFTFSIQGIDDAKTQQILGVKGFSDQHGIFTYIGGGDEISDYYVQEFFLDIEQNIPNLKINIRTFFQNIDVFIDAFQIYDPLISQNNIFDNLLFFKNSEKVYFYGANEIKIDFRHLNLFSSQPFSLTSNISKEFLIDNIAKGEYCLKIRHKSKKISNARKSLVIV